MGKAPAFQFYPGDWIQDTRILTPLTRGIWIDMLCFMWRSNERGMIQGTPGQLARMLSCDESEIESSIKELSVTGIADVTLVCNGKKIEQKEIHGFDFKYCNGDVTRYKEPENAVFSENSALHVTQRNVFVTVENRRMRRDETSRKLTRSRVQRFRNSGVKRTCNANVTAPSSSSSSLTPIVPTNRDGDLFEIFWKNYPKKIGKGAAQKAWKKIREPTRVLEQMKLVLPKQKISEQWTKDNGQYIPNPATYLNQRRWEDETIQ